MLVFHFNRPLTWGGVACLLFATLFTACRKDHHHHGTEASDYANLAIGNYWIYETVRIDPDGTETLQSYTDSCYISKDTVIGAHTYFVLDRTILGSTPERYYWRESSGLIVDQNGKIVLSLDSTITLDAYTFSSGILDSIAEVTVTMKDIDASTTTPLGTFTTINHNQEWTFYPAFQGAGAVRNITMRFGRETGIVTKDFFFLSNPAIYQQRLIRKNN